MRKKNKILMMVISSLLCLTLISSCLVSGVFAKYVTKDTGTVSTVFKKWGVTVTADVRDDLQKYITSQSGAATVTIAGLNIKPGDDYSDALRFTITGTPEVKCRVKLTVQFFYGNSEEYDYDRIKVVGVDGVEASTDKYCMPVGFTFGAPKNRTSKEYIISNAYVVDPWREYTGKSPSSNDTTKPSSFSNVGMNSTEKLLVNGIRDKLDGVTSTMTTNSYIYKDFDPSSTNSKINKVAFYAKNGDVPINTLELGFAWPYENGTDEDTIAMYDNYSNIIAQKVAAKSEFITITYTISVEQIK